MHGCEVHLPNGNAIVIDGCGDTGEETEAITRLVAGAPGLLEDAKHLLQEIQLGFSQVPAGVDAWMATLKTTIANIERNRYDRP